MPQPGQRGGPSTDCPSVEAAFGQKWPSFSSQSLAGNSLEKVWPWNERYARFKDVATGDCLPTPVAASKVLQRGTWVAQ